MSEYKKYLPSKKFTAIILFVVILIAVFFIVKETISFFKKKKLEKEDPTSITVINRIQKDSNNNGITDVEEYLWGLDPNKNGPENKEFILAKKKSLILSGDMVAPDDARSITDHEMLSQQFFATIISLQQTGELDETTMKTVSEAIGKNIETSPIPDIYTRDMIKIQNDSTVASTNYRNNLSNLINKYANADIGSELTFIVQGLNNNDPQALYAAKTVADAYQSFGKEFVKILVPRSLAEAHLSAANNYEKTGKSIKELAQILTDPLLGMKAIIDYKNYSDKLASDLEKISELLQ